MRSNKGIIAVVTSHTPSLIWFRMEMMQAFRERGYDIYAVGNEPEEVWKEKFDRFGIKYRQVRIDRNGTSITNDISSIIAYIHLFRQIKPTKVFLYQAKPIIYAGIALRLLGANEVYPLVAGLGSLFSDNRKKCNVAKRIMLIGYCLSFKQANVIFFQNDDDVKSLTEYHVVPGWKRIVVLDGSGVNLERFAMLALPKSTNVIFIGRLIQDKGIMEYLEACKIIKTNHPEIRCLLIGAFDTNPTSVDKSTIREYTENGIVEYYGEQEDVRPFIAQSSILILPSYREGTPKVILEAMACGRAIITTDVPGCRNTIGYSGKGGMLIPAKDANAIVDSVEQLAKNPELISEMGAWNRERVEDIFDVHKVNLSIARAMGLDSNQKRILVVCQYYYPETFQITSICEQLVRDGNKVTVLTGLPNYNTGYVIEEYRHGHRHEMINGVEVIRCHEVGRSNSRLRLAINYFSYMVSSWRKSIRIQGIFDIVFCYQLSPIFMAVAALRYAKRKKVPFLLYCCDLWPESLKTYIKSEKNVLFRVSKWISKKVYSASDRILVQSVSFKEYLQEIHGIKEDRMRYVPAFADEAYLSNDFTPEGEVVDFVYMGNLGIAQDLISVLKAVDRLRDLNGFKLHFVGDGISLEEMRKFVKTKKLDKIVVFHGRKPLEDMPKYYKIADACLASLVGDNATGLSFPQKIFGYMAAGKPIFAMMNGPVGDVIREADCGICVPAGDWMSLSEAMRDFITNRGKYALCGERARQYFTAHFTKRKYIDSIEEEIETLLDRWETKECIDEGKML